MSRERSLGAGPGLLLRPPVGESLLDVRALGVDLRAGPGGEFRTVVARLDLSMAPGDTVGLVGPSGCGKTVTALALMGLLPPGRSRLLAESSIRFRGEELVGGEGEAGRRVRGRGMAMVFQEPMTSLNPVRRVGSQLREVLSLHGGLRGVRAETRAVELLREVGIDDGERRLRAFPHQLSGGLRQRVMLALALAGDPAVLFADEPTTALDVTTQAGVLDLLADLVRTRDMALVLISHDLKVVSGLCERILVMHQGRIVEEGETKELLLVPRHGYTRALIDSARQTGPLIAKGAGPWRHPPPPDAAPLLEARGVVRGYAAGRAFRGRRRRAGGHIQALAGVTLELWPGECVAVVGESGAGKSTLARVLAGIEKPDGGEVRYGGVPVGELDPDAAREFRSAVQLVFQDPFSSLTPRMRVGAAVEEALAVRSPEQDAGIRQQRAAELFIRVGLTPNLLGRYPHELSGGQRQRVVLARALAPGPRVLVLDEPTSALDPPVRARVIELLREIRERSGVAMVVVAHDFSVVERMADRIYVLYAGRVVEHGPLIPVTRRPSHPYTAALLAAVPTLTTGIPKRPDTGGDPLPGTHDRREFGCPYHSRCGHPGRDQVCQAALPPLKVLAPGQFAACFKTGTIESDGG